MKALKFDKLFLLQRLKENRNKHESIFNEAIQEFRKKLLDALEERIKLIQSDEAKEWHGNIELSKPEHHIAEYDRTILMIEHCTQTEIELSESEYAQYIMDDWHWQRSFLTLNSSYSGMAASGCVILGY